MSACGMQYSDIVFEQTRSRVTMSGSFDVDGVNTALDEIDEELERFRKHLHGAERAQYRKEYFAEARYKSQVWELDTPLPVKRFRSREGRGGAGRGVPHRARPRLCGARRAERGRVRQLARQDLDPAVEPGEAGRQAGGAPQAEAVGDAAGLFRRRTISARRRCSAAPSSSPATSSRARRSSRSRPRPSWSIRA